jgi:hypothetical protein
MKKLVLLLLCFASAAYGEIYTWKDAHGTLFYTNSLYEIPARYRSRAKLLDVATGKKKPISATQPGAQAGAGTPGTPGTPASTQQPPVQQPLVQQPMAQQPPPQPPPPVAQAHAPAPVNPALANPAAQVPSPSAPPQRPIRRRVPRNQDE